MSLDAIFTHACVKQLSAYTTKKQLFHDLVHALSAAGIFEGTGQSEADVVSAALEREKLGSTGVGTGVAIPHARVEGIETISGVFAKLSTPMDYDSIDERPVDLVAFLVAPADAGSEHLRALAQISRRLRREDVRARLRAAPDEQSLYFSLMDDASEHVA